MKKAVFYAARCILAIVLVTACGMPVFAGTTGKITGMIKDQVTKAPLIGTNVLLEGTNMGAVTEPDGSFTIINCPPGIYSVRFTMMGYKRTIVKNVRVSVDLTTSVDANLEPTVLEGETVNIVQERPLVRKDMTSSLAIVGANEIKNLPVDNIQDVLTLKAGVTEQGGQIHVRGGRGGEVAYWVDGVPMTTSGRSMGINVENAAVQELQVVSGTFNAEYGKAMSGIVNIITKEGQEKYSGDINGYVEDYVSSSETFGNLIGVNRVYDPNTKIYRGQGVYEYPIRKTEPMVYDVQPVLSGPVPFTNGMMTFFANGRFRSWKGWEHGRRWWTPIGWPGDSSQVVLNENTTNSFMAKLAYRLSTHFNLKYQLMFDNGDGTDVNRSFTYTPDAKNHWKSERWTHMFSVNHVLSPKTFYELRGARYYGENESYMLGSPLDSCTYLVHVEADTSRDLPEETFDPVLEPARLDSAKALRRLYYFITNPTSQLGYVHQDSSGVPTAYSFNRAGYPYMGNNKGHEGYWLGKFDLTSQITKVHQIKAGLEFKISELFQDNFSIIPRNRIGTSGNLEQEVPFKPEIPGDSTVNRNIYTRKPREYSAYLQDKIELKDLIVNIGVRYDYFDPNTVVPLDPKDPNIYFPMLPEHRYENYIPPDPSLSAPEREAWMRQFSLLTPDQRRALMQTATEPVFAVSPRLGLSYPITDQGIIHFCYGHFFAMPNMSLLYQSPDFKFNQGGGLSAFGNPALKPERTVQYEIGLQQQLSQNIGFDVTLFYKDIRDWAGAGPRIETYLPSITYSMMENKDYANIRGITFSLTKRHSNHFSANVDYTFQYAEGTYTDPFDAFNALANNQERRLSLIPLGYDQRHTLNTDVNFSYGTWSVTLLGQYHTGNPYTPASARGQSLGVGIRENSEYTPTVKNVDLYVNKFFDLGGLRLSLFAKVYNLFDIRNAYGVFADTGSPDYTTTVDATKQPYNALRVGTVEESIRNPYFVSGPRRVQVGMSVGF